jgi:hypothetical protein
MTSADLSSPEVIRQLRSHFVRFEASCRQALSGGRGDVQRTLEWLRREQLPHWKQQLRKREDLVTEARSKLTLARGAPERMRSPSCFDERKALERAQALHAEAEEKILMIQKWLDVIEEKTEKLLQPCIGLSILLDSLGPEALNRLDRMLDNLDAYFHPAVRVPPPTSTSGGPPNAPAEQL